MWHVLDKTGQEDCRSPFFVATAPPHTHADNQEAAVLYFMTGGTELNDAEKAASIENSLLMVIYRVLWKANM